MIDDYTLHARGTFAADHSPLKLPYQGQLRFSTQLAGEQEGRLLYAHGLGWCFWDGRRWAPDAGNAHATRAVVAMLRSDWARALGNDDLSKDIAKCFSARQVEGILALARVDERLNAEAATVDADPWLLNTVNGTVDLRTGELRPHDPADRLTKVCGAAYHPDAHSELWEAFLQRCLPDPAVRAYLQRWAGQALAGTVREHSFPIATGIGANGKSTFVETFDFTLGDYATTVPPELFLENRWPDANRPSPALMALRGIRVATCSETEKGRRLAAALVKNLTGGDKLTARQLHQEQVSWEPSHHVLMITNHLPRIDGSDPALWRRVTVIPWDVVIPDAERDEGLKEKLYLDADAILAWAIAGYRDWHDNGLNPPPAVQAATATYERASDAVSRFLDERCLVMRTVRVRKSDLAAAWSTWSREDGCDMTARDLTEDLTNRGFKETRTKTARFWVGLDLQRDDEPDDNPFH